RPALGARCLPPGLQSIPDVRIRLARTPSARASLCESRSTRTERPDPLQKLVLALSTYGAPRFSSNNRPGSSRSLLPTLNLSMSLPALIFRPRPRQNSYDRTYAGIAYSDKTY